MQLFRETASVHWASGELVNDDHLTFFDHVVFVALVNDHRPQTVIQVWDYARVSRTVDVVSLKDASIAQSAFNFFYTCVGQIDTLRLEFFDVITIGFLSINAIFATWNQIADHAGKQAVVVTGFVGGSRDDQRGTSLIDQDVVNFVNDAEVMSTLDHLLVRKHHVIAQIVEAELIVRAVGNIGGVGFAARDGPEILVTLIVAGKSRIEHERTASRIGGGILADSRAHAEQMINRPHFLH